MDFFQLLLNAGGEGQSARSLHVWWFECDDIAKTVKPKFETVDRQAPRDTDTVARFRFGVVCLLMQQTTFGCEPVLDPQPFKMDQCRLPFAEHHVLQSGDGQKVVFRVHGVFLLVSPV